MCFLIIFIFYIFTYYFQGKKIKKIAAFWKLMMNVINHYIKTDECLKRRCVMFHQSPVRNSSGGLKCLNLPWVSKLEKKWTWKWETKFTWLFKNKVSNLQYLFPPPSAFSPNFSNQMIYILFFSSPLSGFSTMKWLYK